MAIDVNELLAPIPGSDPAGSDESFSRALARADAAMYQAKEGGKNQVVIAD